ncbi:MAG: MMPL family protein, partial [Pseudomonadota bacterium]
MRWSFIALIVAAVTGLCIAGVYRLKFETDILAALPQSDPVLSDARSVIMHHPAQDRIVIDVSLQRDDSSLLLEGAGLIEARLRASGLFKDVGLGSMQQLMPELISHVVRHLSLLFSENELQETIKPLLAKEKIRQTLADAVAQLGGLEGIGQADMLSRDPLGLRNVVLSRLS